MLTKIKNLIFYAFVFSLPWQTVFLLREIIVDGEKFQYGTIGIYLFQIILLSWITPNIKKIFSCTEKRIIYFLAIYLFFIFSSIFWSGDKALSFYFFTCHLLGVILFLIIQSSALNFKKFTFSLILSMTLVSILGLYQFFYQSSFSSKWLGLSIHSPWQGGTSVIITDSGRFLRSYGSMPHPNILGGMLTIVILLSIGAYFKANKDELRWKMFLVFTLPINYLAIITTFSRSAIFSAAIGIFLISFYFILIEKSKKKKDLLVLFYALLILTLLFSTAFSDLISSRTSSSSRLEKKSINDRIIYLEDAKKIIAEKPLLGVGLGQYSNNVLLKNKYSREIWNIQPAHNIYFIIFAEIGFLGFSVLLFFIVFNLLEVFKIIREKNTNRVIFSFIFLALLIISLFDHWLWTTPLGILVFWLILGFSKEKNLQCI